MLELGELPKIHVVLINKKEPGVFETKRTILQTVGYP
jgi:hypothetical protein